MGLGCHVGFYTVTMFGLEVTKAECADEEERGDP
jgi:hypothetical protein